MKILMIEPSGKRGLCQYTHSLANAIAKRNHQVLLATAIAFETRNLSRNYEVLEVFDRFSLHPIRILKFFISLRKFRPDVIHIQGAIYPEIYLVLWKTLERIATHSQFIYTSHDILPKRKIKLQYFLKQLYQGMPHIIVHAKQNKEQLIKKFNRNPDKISVLSVGNLMAISDITKRQGAATKWSCPEPFDFAQDGLAEGSYRSGEQTKKTSPKNKFFQCNSMKSENEIQILEDKKIILFFGVIEPQKGLITLIRAFPEIKKVVFNARLLIVGQPFEDMSQYLEEIKRLNIEDSVDLQLGYVPMHEVPNVFKVAHLLVLPYNRVSQSGIILAAYSFGKPVVATSVGGIPELIDNGKTGFLVPPGDSKAMAKAVIRILKDDDLRKKMGEKAVEIVRKHHSWDTIAEKTERIYRSLIRPES